MLWQQRSPDGAISAFTLVCDALWRHPGWADPDFARVKNARSIRATARKQQMSRNIRGQFEKGHAGNAHGRPRGSRNKLGESFLQELYADWIAHGKEAIRKVREEMPHVYLKVVASLIPKQLEIRENAFDGVSDDELDAIIAYARNALKVAGEDVSAGEEETAH
jgi:hypothetical protein